MARHAKQSGLDRITIVVDESGWAPRGTTLSGVLTGESLEPDDAGAPLWLVKLDMPISTNTGVVIIVGIQQRHKGRPFNPQKSSAAVNLHLLPDGEAGTRRFVAVAIASPQHMTK